MIKLTDILSEIKEDIRFESPYRTKVIKTPYVSGTIRLVGDDGDDELDVEILDWQSKYIEHGGTEKVLKMLKKKYGGDIRAVDVGYEGDESFQYWLHMLNKGLIDGFYDDDMILYDKENLDYLLKQ